MSFKIMVKESLFVVSISQIRINAKFKAQLDIFLKFGSEKEELWSGLKIDDSKVEIPQLNHKEHLKQFGNSNNQVSEKNKKNARLVFELRSKSYNAYAGQVEIDFSQAQNTKHQGKIQYCIDENAIMVYEFNRKAEDAKLGLRRQKSMTQNDIKVVKSLKKEQNKAEQKQGEVQQGKIQDSVLKKTIATSSESMKYKLNINAAIKQKSFTIKTEPSSINQSMSTSHVKKKISIVKNINTLAEKQQQALSEIESINEKSSITKKIKSPTNYITGGQQISKKLIGLEKRLNDEKEKSSELEVELQASKCEVKQLAGQVKSGQKKVQMIDTELKKVKSQYIILAKQNKSLKDSIQTLKQKLVEKTQQLSLFKSRNKSNESSLKQELKSLYQKLQAIHQEKDSQNYQKINLQDKCEQIVKRYSLQVEHKQFSFEVEKDKLSKVMKKLQDESQKAKESLTKTLQFLGHRLDQIFNNHISDMVFYDDSRQFDIGSITELESSTSMTVNPHQLEELRLDEKCSFRLKQIMIKCQKASLEMYNQKGHNKALIDLKDSQIKQLKFQARQLSKQVSSLEETIQNEKEKHKKNVEELSNTYEEDKQSFNKQINQLKRSVKQGQNQIHKQRQNITQKQKQISFLTQSNQNLSQQVAKHSQQLILKTQQFSTKVAQINKKLQKQQLICSELTQNNSILSNNFHAVKQANQSMLDQTNQLKDMINEITDQFTKNKKQKLSSSNGKDLSHKVNNFKQNLKALQQAKSQIQKKLQHMQSQIVSLRQDKIKRQQEYSKIQNIFNLTQKTENSLKNCIISMKKQNEDLMAELKKKKYFEQEIEDEFQCRFDQIRENIIFYMQENKQLQKCKGGYEKQIILKTKKLNAIIESLDGELNELLQLQSWVETQHNKIGQEIVELKKVIGESMNPSIINYKPLKESIESISKVLSFVSEKYSQTHISVANNRRARSNHGISLRKAQTIDNLNKTLLKKNSLAIDLNSSQKLCLKNSKSSQTLDQQLKKYANRMSKKSLRQSNKLFSIKEFNEYEPNTNRNEVTNDKHVSTASEQAKDNKLEKVESVKSLSNQIPSFRERYNKKKTNDNLSEAKKGLKMQTSGK